MKRGRQPRNATGAEPYSFSRRALLWSTLAYSLMILGAIGAMFHICSYDETVIAPRAAKAMSSAETTAANPDVLLHVLVALTTVVIAWRKAETGRTLGPGPASETNRPNSPRRSTFPPKSNQSIEAISSNFKTVYLPGEDRHAREAPELIQIYSRGFQLQPSIDTPT